MIVATTNPRFMYQIAGQLEAVALLAENYDSVATLDNVGIYETARDTFMVIESGDTNIYAMSLSSKHQPAGWSINEDVVKAISFIQSKTNVNLGDKYKELVESYMAKADEADRKKVEEEHINLDDEILNYIATNIKTNIREIEGALNKLIAYSNIEHTDITLEIAEQELANIIAPEKPREITPQLIVEVVAEYYGITVDQMISKNKSKNITEPRQIAMYLCRELTNNPLESIGKLLGGRDHSTIIHGANKVADEYKRNDEYKKQIDSIMKKIKPD